MLNVRMMKSENGSLLVSETSMSPKDNDPSFGQYWIHFIYLNVHNNYTYCMYHAITVIWKIVTSSIILNILKN